MSYPVPHSVSFSPSWLIEDKRAGQQTAREVRSPIGRVAVDDEYLVHTGGNPWKHMRQILGFVEGTDQGGNPREAATSRFHWLSYERGTTYSHT
jgi:hypothetical protein